MLNMSGNDAFPQWNPFADLSATTTSSPNGMLQSPYASLRMAAYPAPPPPHSGNNMDLAYGQAHVRGAPGGAGGYHYGIQSSVIGPYGAATNSSRATGHQFSIVDSFNSTNPSLEGIKIDYINKHI